VWTPPRRASALILETDNGSGLRPLPRHISPWPTGAGGTLPDDVSFEQRPSLGIPGLTAAHAVFNGGYVADKTLLIQGGAGTARLSGLQFRPLSAGAVSSPPPGKAVETRKVRGAMWC